VHLRCKQLSEVALRRWDSPLFFWRGRSGETVAIVVMYLQCVRGYSPCKDVVVNFETTSLNEQCNEINPISKIKALG
jgi:hypothetical protein